MGISSFGVHLKGKSEIIKLRCRYDSSEKKVFITKNDGLIAMD